MAHMPYKGVAKFPATEAWEGGMIQQRNNQREGNVEGATNDTSLDVSGATLV